MEIEIRGSDIAVVRGYVNVCERFSRPIRIRGKSFVEKIKSGAFGRAIEKAKAENRAIDMFIDHNKEALANTSDGSLRLKEDSIGLFAEAEIRGTELVERVRKGAKGWSFGFVAEKDEFNANDGIEERTIEEMELREVSLILNKNPCYSATSVEVRSDDTERVIEERGSSDEAVIIEKKTKEEVTLGIYPEVYKARLEVFKNEI